MGYIMLEYIAWVLVVISLATLLFFVQLVLMLCSEGIAYILERSATLLARLRKSSDLGTGSGLVQVYARAGDKEPTRLTKMSRARRRIRVDPLADGFTVTEEAHTVVGREL